MVLNKTSKVSISNRNINNYKELGYNCNLGDFIDVSIEHINKYSRAIITAKCEFCGKIKNITYKKYTTNIENGNVFSCSKKCSKNKTIVTNIERYGFDHPMKSPDIKTKTINTNLERFGVENPFQSEEIKENIKNKNLEKWGSEFASKSKEVKDKIINTNKEKWGVEFYFQSGDFKIKSLNTLISNYGVEHPMKSPDIKYKIKETNLERWGVECVLQSEYIKEKSKITKLEKYGFEFYTNNDKRKKTNLERYGVECVSQSEEKRKIYNKNCKDPNYIEYLGDNISEYFCKNGHKFAITSDRYHTRKRNNISLCTVCNPIGDSQSIKEKELFEFIKSIYTGEIIQSYRDVLEIDIYLPELKLGFEFNGLYWHSDLYKDKWYHLNKTKHFSEKGIRIIHIWEDDWVNNDLILKSQIVNWLGLTTNKVFARRCKVREIADSKIVTKFLEENHIQGKVNSCLKLGLYLNDELVSLMTFDHYEGRKKMLDNEWNINRFCNKIDCNVIGAASKLFNHFLSNYDVSRVISYADRDWSEGNLYERLDFKKINKSNPDYKYIVREKRIHKSRFRKSLTKISENKLDILKIWDCGKIKYEYRVIKY